MCARRLPCSGVTASARAALRRVPGNWVEGDRIDVLASLVDAYEAEHDPGVSSIVEICDEEATTCGSSPTRKPGSIQRPPACTLTSPRGPDGRSRTRLKRAR